MKPIKLNIAAWLVRYRKILFLVMTLVTLGSILLIPQTNVNADMVKYLPDDSPMKQGLDVMAQQLPAVQEMMYETGGLVTDGNALMPPDLPRTIGIGVMFIFIILIIMSASVMEVLLFLVCIGYAVLINMGTNALLPSVSMMTHTISSVLIMVLSMDYSIILMNRYRQEKAAGDAPVSAMETAVGQSASAILSSAFTTVVSLLMLVFIKLKIGQDLGIVLAKGVTLALVCNFTVLPALILWADKAIERSRKKMLHLPFEALSSFEYRFRYPLVAVFLAAFVLFCVLQRRTQLTFAPEWQSEALAMRAQQNAMMLIYATPEEDTIPALLDSLAKDPRVVSAVSYPSLVKRPRTVEELSSLLAEAGANAFADMEEIPDLPEDLLKIVYYAHAHPQRTEKFSLRELMVTVDSLQAKGLLPQEWNPASFTEALTTPEPPVEAPAPLPVEVVEKPVEIPEEVPSLVDTLETPVNRSVVDDFVVADNNPRRPPSLTYEQAVGSYTADSLAAILGLDAKQLSQLYRLARRRSMTIQEFLDFFRGKILTNKLYSSFLPKDVDFKGRAAQFQARLDSVLTAGPTPVLPPEMPSDSLLVAFADTLKALPDTLPAVSLVPATHPEQEPEEEYVPTPQEILLEMFLSGRKYSSTRVAGALSAAGIPVSKDHTDLLYLYAASQRDFDPSTAISPETLLDFVADTLMENPAIAPLLDSAARAQVLGTRSRLTESVGMLRGKDYSAAVALSNYDEESEATFDYVSRARAMADDALSEPHYWVGPSEMYKELKDGFPRELLLLTILTVLSIFVIVALNFRSPLIPVPLIMTILTGIYANIWASGLGGNTMYFLSYLIIQSVLMGATIDYSILFTTYYLKSRNSLGIKESVKDAYRGASHSILTSGLILSIAPYVMSMVLEDPVIASIMRSLSVGTMVILLLILVLLPGVVAALDPLLRKR